jgi:glycosyltransferase involved in cell wall biosynthesis
VTGQQLHLCLVCREVGVGAASGPARANRDLAEALAERGHQVRLITDRSAVPAPDLAGVTIERMVVPLASGPFRGARRESSEHNLQYAAAVYRTVRRIHEDERPVDAVLATLWRSEAAVCLLDTRFPTVVSCITSLRTMLDIDPRYRMLDDLDRRLALERAALERSPYLHGLTEHVLAKTIADYDLHPRATAVVGRGLCERPLATGRSSNGTSGHVLFVGRIEPRKGVDTLLGAVSELIDDGVDVRLTLVGPEDDRTIRQSFEDAAAGRLGPLRAVRFAGQLPDDELSQLYAEADVVCLPSRYESHGVALIEALMFGKPLVTCGAGATGEALEPERSVLVAPPGDVPALAACIRRLLDDPQLRTRLGVGAREAYAQRFSAACVAEQMSSLFESVIALHAGTEHQGDDVGRRLELLLGDVLSLTPEQARMSARELLDPADGEPLRRLRAAALQCGPPVAERLGTELVLLLDDDAELMPGAVGHLVSELEAHPEAAAVTATVVASDGLVSHSGGSLKVFDGVATFELIGAGLELESGELPPSGRTGWIPTTAALIRRELLTHFPFDPGMTGYFEDNEWCLRIARARPDAFRRSREALAFHQQSSRYPTGASNEDRVLAVTLLESLAHFYELHGLLLAPALFRDVVPQLYADDGSYAVMDARLLLELVSAKGPAWTLAAWRRGDLDGLLGARRTRAALLARESELSDAEGEIERLREQLIEQDQKHQFLYRRHLTLRSVEEGSWWQLRARLSRVLSLASRLRNRVSRGG